MGRIGVWGDPPTDIRLINLGLEEGLLLRQSTMHGGAVASWGTLLLIEKDDVAEVGSLDFGVDTYGSCLPKSGPNETFNPCIKYRCELRPEPRKGGLSDIHMEKAGTEWNDASKRVARVHELITYRFNGKRYVEIGSTAVR